MGATINNAKNFIRIDELLLMLHSLPELLTTIIISFSFAGLVSSIISIKQSTTHFQVLSIYSIHS